MTLAARKPDPYAAIRCDVVGMTGDLVRLRAPAGTDLFDDPLAALGLAIGDVVLLDSGVYDESAHDDAMCVAGEVIGLPRSGVVEVRAAAAFAKGTKAIAVSRARVGERECAAWEPNEETRAFVARMAKGEE